MVASEKLEYIHFKSGEIVLEVFSLLNKSVEAKNMIKSQNSNGPYRQRRLFH